MKKRLFLSLPAVIDDYQALQKAFEGVVSGRWTPPENLHLTLSFFGDLFEQDVLIEKLGALDLAVTPSVISGLGVFKRKKILYADVENSSLAAVYEELNRTFELPATKAFIPHMTLMRFKEIIDEERFDKLIDHYSGHKIGSLGGTLELMQSELHREGARYTLVKRFDNDHL